MNEIDVAIPHDHPAFAGHFPGHPVLPGALLLAHALQALETAGISTSRCEISSAKFFSPVTPGEPIRLGWEALPGKPMRLEMSVHGRRVASVALVLHDAPPRDCT